MPRHPPCALIHLQTQKPKMCFNNKIAQTNNNHPHPETPRNMSTRSSLGCSQPLSTTQTPHPTTKTRRQPADPQPLRHALGHSAPTHEHTLPATNPQTN